MLSDQERTFDEGAESLPFNFVTYASVLNCFGCRRALGRSRCVFVRAETFPDGKRRERERERERGGGGKELHQGRLEYCIVLYCSGKARNIEICQISIIFDE